MTRLALENMFPEKVFAPRKVCVPAKVAKFGAAALSTPFTKAVVASRCDSSDSAGVTAVVIVPVKFLSAVTICGVLRVTKSEMEFATNAVVAKRNELSPAACVSAVELPTNDLIPEMA